MAKEGEKNHENNGDNKGRMNADDGRVDIDMTNNADIAINIGNKAIGL